MEKINVRLPSLLLEKIDVKWSNAAIRAGPRRSAMRFGIGSTRRPSLRGDHRGPREKQETTRAWGNTLPQGGREQLESATGSIYKFENPTGMIRNWSETDAKTELTSRSRQ